MCTELGIQNLAKPPDPPDRSNHRCLSLKLQHQLLEPSQYLIATQLVASCSEFTRKRDRKRRRRVGYHGSRKGDGLDLEQKLDRNLVRNRRQAALRPDRDLVERLQADRQARDWSTVEQCFPKIGLLILVLPHSTDRLKKLGLQILPFSRRRSWRCLNRTGRYSHLETNLSQMLVAGDQRRQVDCWTENLQFLNHKRSQPALKTKVR